MAVLIGEAYPEALMDALDETGLRSEAFPPDCPFAVAQVLDPDYLPDDES